MDAGIAGIISSVVQGIFAIVGGIILFYLQRNLSKLNNVEKNIVQAEKKTEASIKKISESVPSWKLLFENDENGNQIKGSVDELMEAVREGYPIKIRFDRGKDHFEVMDAQWLFVDRDKNLVHASNISQVSLTDDARGNYYHLDDPYHYFVVVNNSGYHHAKRVYISGKDSNPSEDKRHMAWIGLVPPN